MNPSPFVSVIIPVCNEAAYISAVISSIFSQEQSEGEYEIIVADGMSDDGTRDILAELQVRHPRLKVIDNPMRRTPAGLNAAIATAKGSVIIRMDAHTIYAQDYLKQCVTIHQETGADNVGGPWVARGKGYISKAIAAAFQSPFAVGGARGHRLEYTGPVDTVYLGCWPIETFRKFGLFDEELVRNQDDEHNLRIIRGGGRVWQSPRIKSWYTPRSSLRALFRQYYQYGYWKVRVIQKHRLPASIRHLVPGLFVAGLMACVLVSPFWALARWVGMAAVGCYGGCVLLASLITAGKSEWRLAPILPAVFAAYHFGYGIGFLHGVLDFIVLKRGPRRGATVLTRDSQPRKESHQ